MPLMPGTLHCCWGVSQCSQMLACLLGTCLDPTPPLPRPSQAHVQPPHQTFLFLHPATCTLPPTLPAGATLIAPRLALTAAYCVTPPHGVRDPLLWCGLPDLYNPQPGSFDALQTVHTTT